MVVDVDLTPLEQWEISTERPFLIAGPCSAESEEQVMRTAEEIVKLNKVHVFRAGIWKPRTRPNAFEGIGSVGLQWLRQVKQAYGLPIGTEVANVKHVYEALKYGLDMLWIGARTSANPFAVQEIADALKGVDITVLIKNPVNPDLDLWIGAIERINQAGITKVGAIHRGFSHYEKSKYRNLPQWQIPIELKRRMPGIPLICDPSHICGNRQLLLEVSQKAMDMQYQGLIVESHINPDKALSDAQQQLTPHELSLLMDKLVLRDPLEQDGKTTLQELRLMLDKYDDDLLELMAKRMKVADQIGQYKKENNITILQPQRWDKVISGSIEKGKVKGLSVDFIDELFKAIHQESINRQMRVMNG